VDVATAAVLCRIAQQSGRPQAQVIGRQGLAQIMAGDALVCAGFDVERVVPVDEREHGLQQVVTVRAPAHDVQEQVELGRGRQGKSGVLHGTH